jgi:cytochrome c oxidase assembly protein subunit 15
VKEGFISQVPETEWAQMRRLRRLAFFVWGLFFLVVVAGGTVRVLEAGMGCPDWPTCYGLLIPPTSEAQLPPDYRVRFAVAGRLAEPFDPLKTWAEYINRLLSVVAGLGVLALVGYVWLRFRRYKRLLLYATAIPAALVAEALLGWQVVATYLAQHLVTLHMVFTLVLTILAFMVAAQTYALRGRELRGDSLWYWRLGWLGWVLLGVQVLLGATLRSWVRDLGVETALESVLFYVHRSFSWVVVGFWAYFHWRVYMEPVRLRFARRWAMVTTVLIVTQVFVGAIMSYFSFSGFWKVSHLLLGLLSMNTAYAALYFYKYSEYVHASGSYVFRVA